MRFQPYHLAKPASGIALLLCVVLGSAACQGGSDATPPPRDPGGEPARDDGTEPPADHGSEPPPEEPPIEPIPDDLRAPQQAFNTAPLYNREAPIPPQCYTKTEGRFNPCYTCHQNRIDPDSGNFQNDLFLQGDYNFSEVGSSNHWTNLFADRQAEIAGVSDEEIKAYVAQDNYSVLAPRLQRIGFTGWIPDLDKLAYPQEAFDEQGFARDGSGWVAFNYKPLPSTFWPTNGSTDDVMLRLPTAFRKTAEGVESRAVYLANLTILEAAIKNVSELSSPPIDEDEVGADLDGDGLMDMARRVIRPSRYVGAASDVPVVPMLYPVGVEFLHTVRYLGVDEAGGIYVPPRMKEVRYLYKERFYDPRTLAVIYDKEAIDKQRGFLPQMGWLQDGGALNNLGWRFSGFIENADGELRQQTLEEHFFCKGCHSSIGGTVDQTFAFARKIDGAEGWGYIDLKGMADAPARGSVVPEILQYLQRVGGGDEFRHNREMLARWFDEDGAVREDAVRAADVYTLLAPSPARALALNKAYRAVVREQSFIRGRDAVLQPATHVLQEVDVAQPPLDSEFRFQGQIFLDWSGTSTGAPVAESRGSS